MTQNIIDPTSDPPPSIPFVDSHSDRQIKARQRRRVTKARIEVAKDILALLERDCVLKKKV